MRSIERCLAITLARGGSKRLPRKNVRDLCGRPLIWWTMEAAKRSGSFVDIIVNTDDDEIASISADAGVTVYRRPLDLGGDDVRSEDVMLEMGSTLFGRSVPYDCVVLLEPTSPARKSDLISGGIETWSRWDDGCVVSVSPIDNYWFGLTVEGDALEPIMPEMWLNPLLRRSEAYALTGALYVFQPEILSESCHRGWPEHLSPIRGHVVSDVEILDIDLEDQWARAERIMKSQILPDWGLDVPR